jgi:hypothetical protein
MCPTIILYIIYLHYIIHSNNTALLWPHHDYELRFNAIHLWCKTSVDDYSSEGQSLHQLGHPQNFDIQEPWEQDDDETFSTATTVVSPDVNWDDLLSVERDSTWPVDGEGVSSNDSESMLSGGGEAVLPFDGEGVQSIDVENILSGDGEGVEPVIWDILEWQEGAWFAGAWFAGAYRGARP